MAELEDINLMETGNRLCMECRAKDAQLFCICTDTETFLCEDCLPTHSKKRTRKGHPTWPVSDLQIYKDPGYFDRQETFPGIEGQARLKVTEIDKAIAEYKKTVDKVVGDILAISDTTVSQLEAVKAQLSIDVNASLEEVESTLADAQPRLNAKYGPAFRALVDKPMSFELFLFSPPTVTVPLQLIEFNTNLRLPKDLLADCKAEPRLSPAVFKPSPQPPKAYFNSKNETSDVADYFESIAIYCANFPQSKDLAQCYYNLGCRYKELNLQNKAEIQMQKAIQQFQTYFPHDIDFVRCLVDLGKMYHNMLRFEDAETRYLQAYRISRTNFPKEYTLADCLGNLGLLYKEMGRWKQAEDKMLVACCLLRDGFPDHLSLADNLWNLALVYMEVRRYKEAKKARKEAFRIYKRKGELARITDCKRFLHSH